MLALDTNVNDLLESIKESVKKVLPLPLNMEEPEVWDKTLLQSDMCVLVGITGETQGRMIIDGCAQSFGKLGESMYGMALEGEMLHSFVGEIANMVAGNMCTSISQKGKTVDITPPTILMGEMKLFGFEQGVSFPVKISGVGDISIILLLQEERAA